MKALPVLMYHHVSPNPGLVTISPQCFQAQMRRIAQDGWRSIGSEELEAFFSGHSLPPKSFLITFDDGYLDNYVYAHPVLAEFGLKAMLFIVTGWIGDGAARRESTCPDHGECKRRIAAGNADSVMLRWSEIEIMRQTGTFEFHSHTHSHTRWDRSLPDGAPRREALLADLQRSRESLAAHHGSSSRHLCWPQGYYQPDYLAVAAEAGFDHLYTTHPTINRIGGDAGHIGRIVTKEKSGDWLRRRLNIYASPWLGSLYTRLKGSQ